MQEDDTGVWKVHLRMYLLFYKWPGYIRSMERGGWREEAPLFLDPFPRALALSPGCDLKRHFWPSSGVHKTLLPSLRWFRCYILNTFITLTNGWRAATFLTEKRKKQTPNVDRWRRNCWNTKFFTFWLFSRLHLQSTLSFPEEQHTYTVVMGYL